MRHKSFLIFSSATLVIIGLILLFGPRHWFPGFYNPFYMGVVALASPLIIYLPDSILKKDTPQKIQLAIEMRSVIAFSLSINIAGELGLYQLYTLGFQYDKFAHFLVSMLFAFILGEALKEWGHLSREKVVWTVLFVVFSSGILWEIFEATSDFLFKTQEWGVYGQHITSDTLEDIGFNILGTLAGIIIFKIPKGRPRGRVYDLPQEKVSS